MALNQRFALTCLAAALTVGQAQLAAEAAQPAAAAAVAPAAAPAAEAAKPAFSQEQIQQMVAPIALYPDALLAQVLMSATYPLEIVQAARWVKKNPDVKGEALDAALREQPWDPSVKTMVMFPSVLARMNDNLDWTQDLGDAFLAQEQEVMDGVQRLRKEAQKTGALKDTPQQKVVVEQERVIVEPADPQTVYVPTYDPSAVYGQPVPAQPYYPTVYEQPVQTTTSSTDSAVAFGAGALVGGLLTAAIMWDDDDWDGNHVWHHGPGYWDNDWPGPRYGSNNWNSWRGDTNINGDVCIGRCTSIEKNEWKKQANNFQHNVEHRGGVKYRDNAAVAARHPEVSAARQPGGIDRDAARGKQRPTTLPATADRRPGTTTRPAERPAGESRPSQRPETRSAERPKAESRPAQRPETRPAERPKAEARPAQRPETRQAQPQQRAQAPERSVSRAEPASKSSAFQSSGSSSFERQASQRGAASRSSTGGGGGMRGGGGGGGRGGGGRGR
jgi:uncharacterized membrane protein YgcG